MLGLGSPRPRSGGYYIASHPTLYRHSEAARDDKVGRRSSLLSGRSGVRAGCVGNRIGPGYVMDANALCRLRSLSFATHDALASPNFRNTGLNLDRFPCECCHHACRLLGIFLFDDGFKDIQKYVGCLPGGEGGDHLWLVVEGFIVDITASQFEGVSRRVIVARSSKWHSTLNGRPGHFSQGSESLHDYCWRMKRHYNDKYDGCYDELAHAITATLLTMSTTKKQ